MLRGSSRVARRTAWVAAVVAATFAGPPVAAAREVLRPIPIASLQGQLDTTAPHAFTARGLELVVDGNVSLSLPVFAQVLELDVEASGPVMLTWATRSPGRPFRPFGPPWRHLTLPRTRETVRLDLRITDGWGEGAQPAFGLTGAGTVVVRAIRALPLERTPEAAAAAYDRAALWAPEGIGHTTINFLTRSYWSAARETWLSDVVAGVAAAVFAAALGMGWLRWRRLLPGHAAAAAGLAALGLWNAHMLVRFVPSFTLAPRLDVEERIRDHYDVAPDVGALAALARATLRADERVGVMGVPRGWFAPQTICFNLAPRPCVILTAGEPAAEYTGISGVGRLRHADLDAIVTYRSGPLPDGFVPVAGIGSTSVIARRR